MIAIKYVNSNNDRIMEDRIADNAGGDESALITGDINHEGLSGSSKKPSLLRSPLLRRTTTRTKKTSPPAEDVRVRTSSIENHITTAASTTTDIPVRIAGVSGSDAISQPSSTTTIDSNTKTLQTFDASDGDNSIQDDTGNDDRDSFQLHQVHHNAEFEIKKSTKNDTNDENNDLNISVIESDEEVEVELNRPTRVKQPNQQITGSAATVDTKNLSIVVTGNNIVVEYRDDNGSERKKSSPQVLQNSFGCDAAVKATLAPAAKSIVSNQKQATRRRPKGIMKRPRDSNIAYHHPRRALPPPLPPPGYNRETSSPMSWMTATTADSSEDSSTERQLHFLNAPPTAITTTKKKRVKFDEKLLSEQYHSSKLRRRAKYEQRSSFFGILSMAMPATMPYVIAVLILVASSMIPLPATHRQQQSLNLSLSLEPELTTGQNKRGRANVSKMPTSPPILFDVASRMWDKRAKLEEEAGYISVIDSNAASSATAAAGAIAVVGGSTLPKGGNEKLDTSKGLEVVGMETSKNAIAVAHRFERRNPVAKTVASFFKILRLMLFPFHR